MAVSASDIRLTPNRYVRPGTYIGRVHQPRPITIVGTPRMPCVIGRGNRLAREQDSAHRRSYVYAESLNFSVAPPYQAPLDHDAANDQNLAVLTKASGEAVPYNNWRFIESVTGSGTYDYVQIDDTVFDKNTTYSIDYQSVDTDVLDKLQFSNLRNVIMVGDSEGTARYTEFADYRIVTELTGDPSDTQALLAATTNTYTTGNVSVIATPVLAGTGSVAFGTSNGYSYDYNRTYQLVAQNPLGIAPNRTCEFKLTVTATSGGNDQTSNLPWYSTGSEPVLTISEAAGVVNIALDDNTNFKTGFKLPPWWPNDGIKLTFAFGAGHFTAGDTFTWSAYGAGRMEFSSAHDNTNQFATVQTPVAGTYNVVTPANAFSSGGAVTVNSESDYDDEFDREYDVVVYSIGGAAPARTAVIRWCAHNELPFSEGTFNLAEATPSTLQQVLLEKKIYLDFNFGTAHALADTTNIVTAGAATTLATAIVLWTDFATEYTAHDANGGGVWHTAGSGAHAIAAAAPIDLVTLRTAALDLQTKLLAHFADTTEHVVADGIHTIATVLTASSSLADILAFLNQAKTAYAAHRVSTGFVAGDYWTVQAKTDRRDYSAKDDRSYTITINTVTASAVQLTYNAMDYEGSWGTLTCTGDGVSFPDPYVDLPDNIRLMLRNIGIATPPGRFVLGDKYTFSATCTNYVDWTLVTRESEVIASDDIHFDAPGTITGTPLTYFIILNETPTTILRVKESATGTAVSYGWVTGTPYIYFATDPGVDLQVDYEWKGLEPGIGNNYFITANRKRLDTEFNTPRKFTDRDTMRQSLYPSAGTNHLWIAGEIMFETAFFGGYFVQVQSAADNEIYTLADYRTAIDASESLADISDIIVLSYYNALGYAKQSVEKMCDPFEGKQRLLWVGVPSGTPVGDTVTPDTLVYLARTTLQFGPQSQGKGNVILIDNNTLTRTQQMEDGSVTTLSLDGSFLAAHAAATTAGFSDPAGTILKKDIASFDSIELFTEAEVRDLGGASTVYVNSKGAGVYEYGESKTVDTTEVALNEISARTQEHYVLKRVVAEMNKLIGFVPPSPSAGILLIKTNLVKLLGSMASANVIAPYGSGEDPPTIRPINPNTDVYVLVDSLDQRNYHIGYYFCTRLPIKNIFGLYSVNTAFWDQRSNNAA